MDLESGQWVCSNCHLEFEILYAAGTRRTRGIARPTINKNGGVAIPAGGNGAGSSNPLDT